MKDTIRIILFLDCNLACPYCCNKQERFSSQFKRARFEDIDFRQYRNVCVTGGEPFVRKQYLYGILGGIPQDVNIFLYTNGLLIDNGDVAALRCMRNLVAVNIGLHSVEQLGQLNPHLSILPGIRYRIRDTHYDNLLAVYPWLSSRLVKAWKMDECDMPNEDWVLLEGVPGPVDYETLFPGQ
jgi:organic radical activating enzyme